MATKHPSGLKLPVRPAPAPPPVRVQAQQHCTTKAMPPTQKPAPSLMDSWDFSFDDSFPKQNGSSFVTQWPEKGTNKKIPPPRPPPPKITIGHGRPVNEQSSKPNKQTSKHSSAGTKETVPGRPRELLSSLFSRRGQKAQPMAPPSSLGRSSIPTLPPVPVAIATASLIDLNSPPSSPTPTTRSSSDGLSVDSFGSDGTTSHSHHHSQVESGFEDDSDLFGAVTATPSPVMKDPWSAEPHTPSDPFSPASAAKNIWASTPQDPFSPPRKNNPTPSPTPTPLPATVSTTAPAPGVVGFKPTIIRPKVKSNSSPSVSRSKTPLHTLPVQFDSEVDDERSESPPMPSIPPPAPPADLLAELELCDTNKLNLNAPSCVALFNYEGSHPDDLSFKENDVIELVKEENVDWLRGRLKGREGIFPANFVRVVVSLSDSGGIFATVLYPFAAETWEDLDLQEGAHVRLISRIDADWLYGEYDGKRGQFPASFVDSVPVDLPLRAS